MKGLERDHRSYESFLLLGEIFYKLERYEESLECYNKAFEEYSSKKMKQELKIEQMKRVRKFEEAIKYSDTIKQTKEIDADYWYNKGKTFLMLKKIEHAFHCFEKALELDKKNPELFYDFAHVELLAENQIRSIELLETACLLKPNLIKKLIKDQDFSELNGQNRFQKILKSVPK